MTDIQKACALIKAVLGYCEAACGTTDDEEFYPELHEAYEFVREHEAS